MIADRYQSYTTLAAHETEGVHYAVRLVERPSGIAVLAPHGGWIEPGTSLVAAAIAGDSHSLYCFEGIRSPRPHRDLHITSHRFDEPRALALASRSRTVVAVHGYLEGDAEPVILLGGLDAELAEALVLALGREGVAASRAGHRFPAIDKRNICNLGARGRGVQMELPRLLRDQLVADGAFLERFAGSVRQAAEVVDRDA